MKNILSKREFLGREFYAFCQQEHDKARQVLKAIRPPITPEIRFLIQQERLTESIFGRLLKD